MKYFAPTVLIFVLLASPHVATAQSEPPSRCMNCSDPGPPSVTPPSVSPPPIADDGSRDRAIAADRLAEADRVERERLAEAKRQKDAAFIRDRDATARTLKGSIGTVVSPNGGGLKGSVTVNTGVREFHGTDRDPHDVPLGAWKQLHCAAALTGYGLEAARKASPDFQESSFLLAQAANALNGQPLQVECPTAPPFPDTHGAHVDMDKVKQSEGQIISRAAVIVERMKEHSDNTQAVTPVTTVAPVVESADDKMRRVQRELNVANERKLKGTQQEIDQQRSDTKALARLTLNNANLEEGRFESVVVGEDDSPHQPPKRPKKK